MKFLKSNIAIALGIFILAFGYYFAISCKQYTWVFGGGDAGDWLAQAKIWFLPQPYGSPLYISLAKLVGLLKGNLAWNMTVLLSVLPGALTVSFIYLAIEKVKGKSLALLGALIVLGAAPLLTQSTIIEEYAIATMFVTLALLGWAYKKLYVTILGLALASAVHIIPVLITLLWFAIDYKHRKEWIKYSWIYLVFGIAPYGLILWLFGHSQYQWFEQNLSIGAISDYLGSTSTIGQLSVVDLPKRLLQFVSMYLLSFGVALIPAFRSARKYLLFAVLVGVIAWLYLNDSDPTTWTFIIYSVPFIATLAVLGIKNHKETITVGACACALIAVNALFLNPTTINNANPVGRSLYNATVALPDNSLVVTSQGGFYTLGMFHAIADGKDITLNFISEKGSETDVGYQGWLVWSGLGGKNSLENSMDAFERGVQVFRVKSYLPEHGSSHYITEPYNEYYDKVIGFG